MFNISNTENISANENALMQAELKFRDHQFQEAIQILNNILEIAPHHREALLLKGKSLNALGDKNHAGEIYQNILHHNPTDLEAERLYAWTKHEAGFFAEASNLWEKLRAGHPNITDGYFGGGGALLSLKRFDEADRVLTEGIERFPTALHVFECYARCAQERGAHEEAIARWTLLLSKGAQNVHIRLAACYADMGQFDKAEATLDDAPEQVKSGLQWMSMRAQIAEKHHELTKALVRWDEVATAYPGSADGYIGAFDILQRLGRFEDAQNALIPAIRMFPDSLDVARRSAWLAHYRADWEKAISRWEKIREKFPNQPIGYVGGIASLRATGAYDEAEVIAEEGFQKFPNDLWIKIERAQIALNQKNWELAAERFREAHAHHAHEVGLYPPFIIALTSINQFDEADQLVRDAREIIGENVILSCAFATIATRKREWTEAETRWKAAIHAFPNALQTHLGLAAALREAGQLDASERALKEANVLFPDNIEVQKDLAQTLSRKRDWNRALPLWAELKQKYPSHGEVKDGIRQALWQARQDLALVESEDKFEIPPILLQPDIEQSGDAAELYDLFMKFESIGDTCEFGIVQRRFEAEPLSLLRWASTRPETLVTALDNRLNGVGDPEHTIVSVIHGEYTTRDRRYHMFSHTFTSETAVPQDKFFIQQCKRLQYLREKMLEDLASPEKIFVYKSNHGLNDRQAENLFEAIKRYGGKPYLLCMKLIDDQHAAGDLEMLREGLFIGYTDRFSTIDINVANWVSLCKKVAELWKTANAHSDAAEAVI